MKQTADYTEFDKAILGLLGGGVRGFCSLSAQLNSQAAAFCTEPKQEPFRVVDRRLQSLRKRGLVAHNSKTGWNLVKT